MRNGEEKRKEHPARFPGLQSFIGGGFFKVVDFGGGKESESANSEAVVGDFADACSLEGLDRQSDASEHSFDLPVQPFGDTDFDERAFMPSFEYFDGGVRGFPLGQPDALIKFFDVFALDSALHLSDIGSG